MHMGFFSSRKQDGHGTDSVGTEAVSGSVVKVIRSRFQYGKSKDKEGREPPPKFQAEPTSIGQSLSPSHLPSSKGTVKQRLLSPSRSLTSFHGFSISSRPSNSSPGKSVHADDSPTGTYLNGRNASIRRQPSQREIEREREWERKRPLPSTPSNSNLPVGNASTPASATSATSPHRGKSRDTPMADENMKASDKPSTPMRMQGNNASVTLAQRLNELAAANADGLLNDDEYRMLRQDVFERFAANSAIPSEIPVVPSGRSARSPGSKPDALNPSRISSNFVVEVPRPPSAHSGNSVTSGIATVFRRASGTRHGRHSSSKDYSETSSTLSNTSTSNVSKVVSLVRGLSKKSSNSSLRSEMSLKADTISIASRRTAERTHHQSDSRPSYSTASLRRVAASAPPSSFNKYVGSVQNVFDDQNLKTSKEILEEIAAVEAEGRRLMDAFTGLELSTMAKRQRRQGQLSPASENDGEVSTWTLIPGGKPSSKLGSDTDVNSLRSGMSRNTSASLTKVAGPRPMAKQNGNSSRPGSIHRKNSVSSVSSSSRVLARSNPVPPVPAIPHSGNLGQLSHGSTSSINLAKSTGHLPLSAVLESEIQSVRASLDDPEYDNSMEDIRRRREEVSRRYEARLEFLRAKLKGARLQEKLAKK